VIKKKCHKPIKS